MYTCTTREGNVVKMETLHINVLYSLYSICTLFTGMVRSTADIISDYKIEGFETDDWVTSEVCLGLGPFKEQWGNILSYTLTSTSNYPETHANQ